MPTHRADLTRLNIQQIAALVRAKAHTVRRRLDGLKPVQVNGREMLFDSADALARFFTGESLDLTRERARLARAQSEAQERRNRLEAGELGSWDEFDRVTLGLAVGTRDKMLGISHAIAPLLAVDATVSGCGRIVDDAIRGALEDLAAEGDRAGERLAEVERITSRKRSRAKVARAQ